MPRQHPQYQQDPQVRNQAATTPCLPSLTPPPPLVPPLLPFTLLLSSPFYTLPLLPCPRSPLPRPWLSCPSPPCLSPLSLVDMPSLLPHPHHHHPLPLRLPPPTLKIRSPPARTPLPPTRHCRHSARPRLQNRHLQHAPGLRHPQKQRPR
jgi:hypothetical protein